MNTDRHALVIPLFGCLPQMLLQRLEAFQCSGILLILVINYPEGTDLPADLQQIISRYSEPAVKLVFNHNRGGVAGGFNRGVQTACAAGSRWITLLDQDSDLPPEQLPQLREPWAVHPRGRWIVGPRIWDSRRRCWHGRPLQPEEQPWMKTRLLISSGTTFRAIDWPLLGPMEEWLVVDFVDHAWSFQVQQRGFQLLQHHGVTLEQQFGARHPHWFCRWLGMELYSPRRHFYGLRNLRWLLSRREVPIDLKVKELLKMFFKPWLWLLFEPNPSANLLAILKALREPLPAHRRHAE